MPGMLPGRDSAAADGTCPPSSRNLPRQLLARLEPFGAGTADSGYRDSDTERGGAFIAAIAAPGIPHPGDFGGALLRLFVLSFKPSREKK